VTHAPPFRVHGEHFAIDLPGAHALFSTRRGGSSTGAYTSLNLGRLTRDDPRHVAQNRAALEAEVGAELQFITQVHGSQVRVVNATQAHPGEPTAPPQADAQATALRGVGLVVMTADCLPIVVAGRGAVAVVHAGWRGLAANVVAHGVRALGGLGAGETLQAAIGPGAGACCYEVGLEVHDAFAQLPAAVHQGPRLDLKAVARHQLMAAGVSVVHDISLCTICGDPALFFSHRRDRGVTGRQAGVAWLS
jgi:YfiH family protein